MDNIKSNPLKGLKVDPLRSNTESIPLLAHDTTWPFNFALL